MDKSASTTAKRPGRQILLLLVLVLATAAILAWKIVPEFVARHRTRAAFISAVVSANDFDKLKTAGLFLPRDDGTWVVIKSDAGYMWANWTLAVDSEGKWFETTDRAYELWRELGLYRSYGAKADELRTELRNSDLDLETRNLLKDLLRDAEERQAKLHPFAVQHAATLADARAVLRERGFAEVTGLPRPKLAGVTTRPAPVPPPAGTPVTTAATGTAGSPVP